MVLSVDKLSGRLAKRNGDQFERNVESACRMDQVTLVDIPNGCRRTIRFGKPALIQVASPFDYVAIHQSEVIFFDAKTTDNGTFSHSQLTPHQIEALSETERAGCTSGYLVRFTEHKKCVFFKASELAALKRGESIKHDEGIQCGPDFRPSLLPVFTVNLYEAFGLPTPSP